MKPALLEAKTRLLAIHEEVCGEVLHVPLDDTDNLQKYRQNTTISIVSLQHWYG